MHCICVQRNKNCTAICWQLVAEKLQASPADRVTDRQTDRPAFQPRGAVLSEGRRMGHAVPRIGKT
eukprot:8653775-Pyramimonas_sp.AAC.1